MVAPSAMASPSLLFLLSPLLWNGCASFVTVSPRECSTQPSHRCRAAARAKQGTVRTTAATTAPRQRLASCRRCPSFPSGSSRGRTELQAHPPRYYRGGRVAGSSAAAASGGRDCGDVQWRRSRRRRRNRQRLGAAKPDEGADSGRKVVIDAELSDDDIGEIERADLESKRRRREEPDEGETEEAARDAVKKNVASKKKTARARAPAPAPGPFTFAGSGFTCLEDAVASGQFVDLSDGRNSCLKRVDEAGLEVEGNPSKGSKIKVHYKMKVVGGENIASSGEDRSKPFEFRLGRWPSEATHGWDKAVSAMRKGEVATLICGPQFAFGEAGAPPKIPRNATVETRLELVDWLDLAAAYNAVPGKVETDQELRERWSEDLADGTSPLKDEAGLKKRMQAEMAAKEATAPPNTDHRGKKIYDLKSEEAREIMAKQKLQGYTPDFAYVERVNYLDLYIPVPEGTRAKDVTVEIHPDRMLVVVKGIGVVTKGHFQGKVALDGCYWLMSDLSLDPPGSAALGTQNDEVRQGPVYRGETCVQVFLEKMKPFDTLWESVYRPQEDVEGGVGGGSAPLAGASASTAGAGDGS